MPVKFSGDLVEEARHSAARSHRSLTRQIEHWAAIGRAVEVEARLPGDVGATLLEKRGGAMKIGRVSDAAQREQVTAVLAGFLRMPSRSPAWLGEMSDRGIPLDESEPDEVATIQRKNPDGTIDSLASAR